MSAEAALPSLDDYKPQNKTNKDVLNFSIGADSDGQSVSASYDIVHEDLDITYYSYCNNCTIKKDVKK